MGKSKLIINWVRAGEAAHEAIPEGDGTSVIRANSHSDQPIGIVAARLVVNIDRQVPHGLLPETKTCLRIRRTESGYHSSFNFILVIALFLVWRIVICIRNDGCCARTDNGCVSQHEARRYDLRHLRKRRKRDHQRHKRDNELHQHRAAPVTMKTPNSATLQGLSFRHGSTHGLGWRMAFRVCT